MNKMYFAGLALLLNMTQIGMALAGEIDPASVPAAKQTIAKNYLSAKEAATMKQSMETIASMANQNSRIRLDRRIGPPKLLFVARL